MKYKVNINQFTKNESEVNINITNEEILEVIDLLKEHEYKLKNIEYVIGIEKFKKLDYFTINKFLSKRLEMEEKLRNNISKILKVSSFDDSLSMCEIAKIIDMQTKELRV